MEEHQEPASDEAETPEAYEEETTEETVPTQRPVRYVAALLLLLLGLGLVAAGFAWPHLPGGLRGTAVTLGVVLAIVAAYLAVGASRIGGDKDSRVPGADLPHKKLRTRKVSGFPKRGKMPPKRGRMPRKKGGD